MSRKSSLRGVRDRSPCFQVSPPSVVRRTVPAVPLAQTTLSLTALTPRRRALTPVSCGVHAGARRERQRPRPTAMRDDEVLRHGSAAEAASGSGSVENADISIVSGRIENDRQSPASGRS